MITRENYEEFFLLYVDNELSAAEKNAVERFVDANPDLREEWEATVQCRFTPDPTAAFGDLDLLRKTESINEEQLLLYLDRELDAETATQVGAALRTDKALGKEFEGLHRTILKPDTSIVFPDKSTLYRKEERRIIYMPWLRVAAAAVVVGVIVMIIFKSANRHEEVAKNLKEKTVTPATPQPLHLTEDNDKKAQQQELVAQQQAGQEGQQAAQQQRQQMAQQGHQTTQQQRQAAQDKQRMTPEQQQLAVQPGKTPGAGHTATQIPPKQVPRSPGSEPQPQQIAQVTPDEIKTNDPERTPKLAATHAGTVTQAKNIAVTANKPGTNTTIDPAGASFATQALLADNIEDQEGDGDEPSRKKHKLRGLFRKVSRVLDKSANRDDDDDKHSVLIGGFQFALK